MTDPKSLSKLKVGDKIGVDRLVENSCRHASYGGYGFYELLGFNIVVITESVFGNPFFDKIIEIYDKRTGENKDAP